MLWVVAALAFLFFAFNRADELWDILWVKRIKAITNKVLVEISALLFGVGVCIFVLIWQLGGNSFFKDIAYAVVDVEQGATNEVAASPRQAQSRADYSRKTTPRAEELREAMLREALISMGRERNSFTEEVNNINVCAVVAELARRVMTARQDGQPVESVAKLMSDGRYHEMVLAAYRSSRWESNSAKKSAIERFGDRTFADCMEGLARLNK